MERITLARWSAALAIGLCAQANAQMVPITDFAKRPEAWEVALSPTGDYVAIAVPTPDGMETQLQIVNVDGSGKTQVLRFARQQHVTDVVWTADDRVVVSRAKMDPLKARPFSVGELMTSDVNGKNRDILFGFIPDSETKRGKRKDQGWSSIIKVLDGEPGKALVDFTCWNCGDEPDTVIFEVDTRTGSRKEVERGDKLAWYGFDQTGEARIRTTYDDNDNPVLDYRKAKGGEWLPLPKSVASRTISNIRFDADNNTVYAFVTDALEPEQAYKIDLMAGTRTKLAGRPDVAVSSFMYGGRGGVPFAVTYNADKPLLQYLDPNSEWTKLHASLSRSFPGQMLVFDGFTRDGNKVLFWVWSDREAGNVYVYDRVAKKAQKVIDYRPWLKPEQMSVTRPIEFTARDGQKLFGFYTANGTGPKPLIVMPHGGPIGPHDTWGFGRDVQFLASRGYGVLQVNYRGSGGRGEEFERKGWAQWGDLIQNDITDAVKWTVDNKLADPDRICMYGASFGGYSALMQPILNPGMYKCAIGYVGVYDLPLLREEVHDGGSRRSKRMNDRIIGTDPKALAVASPALRAGEIKVPVMLVHGRDDKTADFNQYKVMENALKAAGKPAETFVAAGEGHGFYKPENVAELYRRMEAFLDKYIGPNAK